MFGGSYIATFEAEIFACYIIHFRGYYLNKRSMNSFDFTLKRFFEAL